MNLQCLQNHSQTVVEYEPKTIYKQTTNCKVSDNDLLHAQTIESMQTAHVMTSLPGQRTHVSFKVRSNTSCLTHSVTLRQQRYRSRSAPARAPCAIWYLSYPGSENLRRKSVKSRTILTRWIGLESSSLSLALELASGLVWMQKGDKGGQQELHPQLFLLPLWLVLVHRHAHKTLTHMSVCMHAHTHAWTHARACTHTHTHTHAHTNKQTKYTQSITHTYLFLSLWANNVNLHACMHTRNQEINFLKRAQMMYQHTLNFEGKYSLKYYWEKQLTQLVW